MAQGGVSAVSIEAKAVRIVAISLGIAIAGVFVWKKIKKSVNLSKERQTQRAADKNVVKSQLTYDEFWYKQASDRLLSAMSGLGTKESTIYSVVGDLKNKSDWYKLVGTFGMRESKARWSKFKGNLISWFENELTGRQMEKVSDKLSEIGVTI
jgi:hypothetical protein